MSTERKVVTLRMTEDTYQKLESIAFHYGYASINAAAVRMIEHHLPVLDEVKEIRKNLQLKTAKLHQLRDLIEKRDEFDRLISEFGRGE